MTKSEALEFLELPETATDSEIKIRVEDKLAYFERLSEKAPSDFLKRLHARNAAKVSEIQMQSKKWPSYVTPEPELASQPDPLIQPNPEPEFVQEEMDMPEEVVIPEAIVIPEPFVTPDPAIGAVIAAGLDPVVEPEVIAESVVDPAPVAWLVRHTENQSSKTFPIYPGKNYLGRKPRPDLVPFIEVEEDPYISKVHAVLYTENDRLFISDPSGDEGKPSKNGIFINADENRLTEKTRLKEKDTIQIGVTKLILRFNNSSIGKIVQEVEEQDYMHTVVIDIS
ncbi:MAG TPA: FHA domain-containing protein [Puia sp.]|nr:FHA domain-containing protein [Puia sp.]